MADPLRYIDASNPISFSTVCPNWPSVTAGPAATPGVYIYEPGLTERRCAYCGTHQFEKAREGVTRRCVSCGAPLQCHHEYLVWIAAPTRATQHCRTKELPMNLGKEMRPLQCKLTAEELEDRGLALARATEDHKGLVDAHASVRAAQKAELAAIEAEIARLAQIVVRRAEPRQVNVLIELRNGEVFYERGDTFEVIYRRAPTDDERQAVLDFDKKG